MTTPTPAPPDRELDPRRPGPDTATLPLYWSVRRELWENRSVTIAPAAVAAVVLFGTFISTVTMPGRLRAGAALDVLAQSGIVLKPYRVAPAPIIVATFLVAIFYCLDALYGERRDRGILFWKSLPVSDRTTVLSKASIPLVVLPLVAYALSLFAQLFLLTLGAAVLAANGMSAAPFWAEMQFLKMPFVLLYGLTAHVLWFAPIYGYLLLVSGWARRAPALWAVLPPLAIGAFEWLAFRTFYFGLFLKYRVAGAMEEAFAVDATRSPITSFAELDPVRFLSSPGLWLGLAATAAFLAAAVRLRRDREPM